MSQNEIVFSLPKYNSVNVEFVLSMSAKMVA